MSGEKSIPANQPLVSIIMPCYNHGVYLTEALESVKKQHYQNYEVIIVNDGSADPATLALLDHLATEVTVIHQPNSGPSVARHRGIQESKGKYLFFLDSDNHVLADYISKAVSVMEADSKVGVVYGDAQIFGAENRRKVSGGFSIDLIIYTNPIDLCSVIRRQTYDDTGGFDTYLSNLGLEDWEFWFAVHASGWQFHYIPEVLFEYRATEASRTVQVANKNLDKIIAHIYHKHSRLVFDQYRELYYLQRDQKSAIDTRIGSAVLAPYRFFKRLLK